MAASRGDGFRFCPVRPHSDCASEPKHRRTIQWYKPTIRIFKNARGWMEDNGLIHNGTASSHAIECLLYNVPDRQFGSSYGDTFVNVVNWMNSADLTNFVCQNGIQRLFDPGRLRTRAPTSGR